jgi:hypothetical protein
MKRHPRNPSRPPFKKGRRGRKDFGLPLYLPLEKGGAIRGWAERWVYCLEKGEGEHLFWSDTYEPTESPLFTKGPY